MNGREKGGFGEERVEKEEREKRGEEGWSYARMASRPGPTTVRRLDTACAHTSLESRGVSTFCRTAYWRLQGYECSQRYTLGHINNREIARSWPSWTPARATSFRSYDTWLHYNRMRGQFRNVDCAQPPLWWCARRGTHGGFLWPQIPS